MAQKSKSVYICSECGYETPRWLGQCPNCNEWNTLNEEIKTVVKEAAKKSLVGSNRGRAYPLARITADTGHRYNTGLKELNRVLGGGLVKGSVVLLSGDPGIGKSTILLQICEYLGGGLKILYVSGEESAHQIKLRASVSQRTARFSVETERRDARSLI